MSCKFAVILGSAGVLILFSALSPLSADDGVPFPNGFRDWYFVNSLTAPAESPLPRAAGSQHLTTPPQLLIRSKSQPFFLWQASR